MDYQETKIYYSFNNLLNRLNSSIALKIVCSEKIDILPVLPLDSPRFTKYYIDESGRYVIDSAEHLEKIVLDWILNAENDLDKDKRELSKILTNRGNLDENMLVLQMFHFQYRILFQQLLLAEREFLMNRISLDELNRKYQSNNSSLKQHLLALKDRIYDYCDKNNLERALPAEVERCMKYI